MKQEQELELQAWVDGELSEADGRRVAQRVAGDPAARALAAELREIKAAMNGAELARTLPESGDFYWSKIERQIHAESARSAPEKPSAMARWRQWLMPLAGFAAATCVVLFTLTPSKPAPVEDGFTSTDGAMETTTFRDQAAGLTVVWLQDKGAPRPLDGAPRLEENSPVTD